MTFDLLKIRQKKQNSGPAKIMDLYGLLWIFTLFYGSLRAGFLSENTVHRTDTKTHTFRLFVYF